MLQYARRKRAKERPLHSPGDRGEYIDHPPRPAPTLSYFSLTDAFERLLVRLLIHEAAGVSVPFDPALPLRGLKTWDRPRTAPLRCPSPVGGFGCHNVQPLFVGQCLWSTVPSMTYNEGTLLCSARGQIKGRAYSRCSDMNLQCTRRFTLIRGVQSVDDIDIALMMMVGDPEGSEMVVQKVWGQVKAGVAAVSIIRC